MSASPTGLAIYPGAIVVIGPSCRRLVTNASVLGKFVTPAEIDDIDASCGDMTP